MLAISPEDAEQVREDAAEVAERDEYRSIRGAAAFQPHSG